MAISPRILGRSTGVTFHFDVCRTNAVVSNEITYRSGNIVHIDWVAMDKPQVQTCSPGETSCSCGGKHGIHKSGLSVEGSGSRTYE